MKKIVILFFLLISLFSFSQRERGNLVDVKGNDVINNVNRTEWRLVRILEKKWLYRVKRKIKPEEEMEISFKDGCITYTFLHDKKKLTCNYRLSSEGRDYEYLTIECAPFDYYWCVYRLSDEKLVIGISIDRYKNYDMKDIGRYVFYRKK